MGLMSRRAVGRLAVLLNKQPAFTYRPIQNSPNLVKIAIQVREKCDEVHIIVWFGRFSLRAKPGSDLNHCKDKGYLRRQEWPDVSVLW